MNWILLPETIMILLTKISPLGGKYLKSAFPCLPSAYNHTLCQQANQLKYIIIQLLSLLASCSMDNAYINKVSSFHKMFRKMYQDQGWANSLKKIQTNTNNNIKKITNTINNIKKSTNTNEQVCILKKWVYRFY